MSDQATRRGTDDALARADRERLRSRAPGWPTYRHRQGAVMADYATDAPAILTDLIAGLSVSDAASKHGIAARTIERWIARGRSDPESRYGVFATQVDRVRAERALPLRPPMGEAEFHLLVAKAARLGNVEALRLMWRMLRREAGGRPRNDPISRRDGCRCPGGGGETSV